MHRRSSTTPIIRAIDRETPNPRRSLRRRRRRCCGLSRSHMQACRELDPETSALEGDRDARGRRLSFETRELIERTTVTDVRQSSARWRYNPSHPFR